MNRSGHNIKKLIIIVGCWLTFVVPLCASSKINVHQISRRDGLSNGAVTAIVKDANGYVWLGTWNGLNRYDGINMVTFLPGINQQGIHNHVIRELYPTESGELWILTNKGVSRYDHLLGRFASFFTQELEHLNYENDISITLSKENGLWVSVFGHGIFSYDTQSEQFNKVSFNNGSQHISAEIIKIHASDNQLFCIAANGQLFSMSGQHLEPIMLLPLSGTILSFTSTDINGHPYLLITQRAGPALLVDLEKRAVNQLNIPNDFISTIAKSLKSERLWIGTEKGNIYEYNLLNQQLEDLEILTDIPAGNSIATRVLSILETASDLLWIGTDGNGVYTLKLTEFPNNSLSSGTLQYPIVRSILVTTTDHLLIGTKGGGIDIFEADGRYIKNLSTADGLSNNSVFSMHQRFDGSIWVGTDGEGVDIVSPDYKTIRNFPRDFANTNDFSFSSVYRVLEDRDRNIFLGTSGYGVIWLTFDKNNPSIPIAFDQVILDQQSGLQKQIVYALAEEKEGIIWIGTRGIGIYRYNTITKRVMGHYTTTTLPEYIKSDDVISLFIDKTNRVYAGSSNGLFSFLPGATDSVQIGHLDKHAGLSNTSIHAIEADHQNNIWVTTNFGLASIDSTWQYVRSFNDNDGLINIEYSDGASFFDEKTNRLFVGGTLGVDIIQPDRIKFSSQFPPIAINRLLIKNQLVETGDQSVLTSSINHQKKLVLKYNQNAFTFHVTPLVYWGQERYRISYRLKNFDDDWVINLPNQPISFTNIEPGSYILQLRVSDENGKWSGIAKEVELEIKPPLWRTFWALMIYIFLFIAFQTLLFLYYRRKEAQKKEALLLEFKMKKEEELQRYKIDFFTNVAHEFRTPLTMITSYIHALLEDTRNTYNDPRFLKVYNNSIKLQKLVLEIMQFRKLEKGKEPLNIKLTRPVELIREVLSDFELLAQKQNILCELITSQPDITFNTDAEKFQRIISNLISNAIKYNNPDGFVHVYVTMENKSLKVEVVDNGAGIKPEYYQKIFEPFGITSASLKGSMPNYRSTGLGLAVTKGLVELLKGQISFDSDVARGARFICIFPDVHELSETNVPVQQAQPADDYNFIDDRDDDLQLTDIKSTARQSTILLVDDDQEILKILREFLHQDYNILFAANGVEAYEKVLNAKPDLVVSDIMMPEMDGIEFCSMIRNNFDTSHIPLILLTAKGEIEDRIAGLKAGADSYIPKPFHPDHLRIRIEKLLQQRLNIKSHFGYPDENPALVKEIPDPFFQKLLNYIDENIDDINLSSGKMCNDLAISKSSLYNKTKSVLGTTPHNLINQRRLSKAIVFLKTTNMTVSEIIDQTGFASRTHFYDLFKNAYGCSPSEYRDKQRVN